MPGMFVSLMPNLRCRFDLGTITPGSYVRPYAVAGDLTVLVKSGLRFSRKAANASFASSERTCALNSSFSAFIAALICSRNGCFMSLLLACSAAAGFAASFPAVSVALAKTSLSDMNLGNQTQLRGAPGVEGSSQQNQLRRTEMTDSRRHRAARSEFRHDSKIDEGHLEFRALGRVDEVAMRQHGGAAADGGAVDRGDERLVEVEQRIHQSGLWRFSRSRRILQKILDIVARAERISRAVPEDDTRVLVIRHLVENAGESHVHG